MKKQNLYLTRRPGERVFLGEPDDGTIVTVSEVRGNQVRLQFHSPSSVKIQREEIVDAGERSRWDDDGGK